MKRYSPKEIEPKWQKIWEESGTYTANLQSDKPKYIAMSMFNYPSGAGIHIGHAMNYTISDVKARFKRQQGYESYHPIGWDAFGLPAENYAIKAGVSPQESMATIIPGYHKQYKAMAWSNDWEKEIATHLPEYYKWTQWIFSEMYRSGLAYQDSRMQWWCTKCQTVLANEQVLDGKCWRHDGPEDPLVEKKEIKQWFFKITDYADELLEAIDDLDWTDSVKLAQKNWIGKSVGAEIDFVLDFGDEKINSKTGPDGKKAHITVFTTRPDTLFGATYLVLAPDHKWVELALEHKTVFQNNDEVATYVDQAVKKTEVERQADQKSKTGVELKGVRAINPATGEKIPIWTADYVLAGYGTGAIMAVPAHDARDNEFAQAFGLPITTVVEPVLVQTDGTAAFKSDSPVVDSNGIIALIKHWSDDKYLGLYWPGPDWGTLLTGGIDDGMAAEETVLKEIREETGFTKAKIVRSLGTIHSKYYHEPKQQNRFGHAPTFYVELEDDTQEDVQADESAKHEVKWLTLKELRTFLTATSHVQAVDLFEGQSYHGEGLMVNSGDYNKLSSRDAGQKIVADLAKSELAREKVNYKMRDWSVSRQRYWGAPIPIIHCEKCGTVLIPNDQLPVQLPELDDFQPSGDGRSALARAKDWLMVDCPQCGGPAERETDTLDTYICSSWYMYRYFDPHNQEKIFDSDIVKKWEPIDFYNGADHATAHLLYARFIARFFTKQGLINEPEPFKQFVFNGKVVNTDGSFFSKSKGVTLDPLDIIDSGYGADALRTYLMFAAPLEVWTKWDPQGVPGTYRFLTRLWNLVQDYLSANVAVSDEEWQKAVYSPTHKMIKKVTEDLEENRYNTAIAAMMECVNSLYKLKKDRFANNEVWKNTLCNVVACVAPFAPHIADELWHQLGHSSSVHLDSWPEWDKRYLESDMITLVVQVNGKVRAQLEVAADISEDEAKTQALANDRVKEYVADKELIKQIYVPGKLVNLVVR